MSYPNLLFVLLSMSQPVYQPLSLPIQISLSVLPKPFFVHVLVRVTASVPYFVPVQACVFVSVPLIPAQAFVCVLVLVTASVSSPHSVLPESLSVFCLCFRQCPSLCLALFEAQPLLVSFTVDPPLSQLLSISQHLSLFRPLSVS